MDFLDADGLAGEDRAEVDFLAAETDSTTAGDHDGFVVEWIVGPAVPDRHGLRGAGPRPGTSCRRLREDGHC